MLRIRTVKNYRPVNSEVNRHVYGKLGKAAEGRRSNTQVMKAGLSQKTNANDEEGVGSAEKEAMICQDA